MNGGGDLEDADPGHEGGALDPREASELLRSTTKQARQDFDIRPPLLTLIGSVVVLVAFGAIWLSVRGQHPYAGPTPVALAVLYGTLVVWIIIVSAFHQRARRGVTGPSLRQQRVEGVVFALIWAMVYVFQGALYHAGVGPSVVYGIYPATAPLIVVGSAAAAYLLARQNWQLAAFATAGAVLAALAAFTGPETVWAVMGLGLCLLLLALSAVQYHRRRA